MLGASRIEMREGGGEGGRTRRTELQQAAERDLLLQLRHLARIVFISRRVFESALGGLRIHGRLVGRLLQLGNGGGVVRMLVPEVGG